MKQHGSIVTIAALALGLGLIAPHAWADDFKLTNSAGATIKYGCSGGALSHTVNNGSSTTLGCSSNTFNVSLTSSGATTYSVNHACADNERHATTASAGSTTGSLSLSTATCEALNNPPE